MGALILALGLVVVGSGCSVRRLAVDKVGDALSGGGTSIASDDDPELVRQAVPFSLKLMESLLAESPGHPGLLRTLAGGFTQYAYAFVQQDADEREAGDFAAAEVLRARARRLYVRGLGYGLRGLEQAHPGFTNALRKSPAAAVTRLKPDDVALVYWTVAAWGSAISLSKDDPARLAEIPQMEALLDRGAGLGETWNDGAFHALLVTYEMSRQGVKGDAAARAKGHFDRALELSGGRLAGPFVSYAESVCVQKQDGRQFKELLERALAIDADAHPESRLVNLIMQRRARWLLSRQEDLFLAPPTPAKP